MGYRQKIAIRRTLTLFWACIFSLFHAINSATELAFCMHNFFFLGSNTRFYLLAIYVHVNKR